MPGRRDQSQGSSHHLESCGRDMASVGLFVCGTIDVAATVEAARPRDTERTDLPMPSYSTTSPEVLAYMAGLFDGEGSISITRKRYGTKARTQRVWSGHSVTISVANKSLEACQLFRDAFGGSINTDRRHQRGPVYHWQAAAQIGETALLSLLPYSRIKRERILLALEFRQLQREANKRRLLRHTAMLEPDATLMAALAARMRQMNHGLPVQTDLPESGYAALCWPQTSGPCPVSVEEGE